MYRLLGVQPKALCSCTVLTTVYPHPSAVLSVCVPVYLLHLCPRKVIRSSGIGFLPEVLHYGPEVLIVTECVHVFLCVFLHICVCKYVACVYIFSVISVCHLYKKLWLREIRS